MRRVLRRLLQLRPKIKVLRHNMCLSKMGLKCNTCRSICCRNITDDTPSSDLPIKTSTGLKDNKLDTTKNAENHSEECSPIPFRLPSLEMFSTPTRMKTVSPLSVPETGNKQKSNESTEKGEEEINNAKSDKVIDEEKKRKHYTP